jgi:hypothetical protein
VVNAALSAILGVVELLRPGVYAPVYCDACAIYRPRITRDEHAVLLVHHRLLCRCGGQLTYIGAGIAGAGR